MIGTKTVGAAKVKALALGSLLAALMAAFVLLTATPAHADTTFTVDRSDDPDLTTTDSADDCTTATANDCSLRGAITAANNTSGADTIDFAIPEDPSTPTDDVKTILLDGTAGPSSTNLPDITEAVTINGYTQPGASPNTNTDLAQGTNANLLIELNGAFIGSSGNGLRINASNVVVKGLVIKCFSTGIFIFGNGSGNVIEGNFIGSDPSVCTINNGVVLFGNSSNNTIGGQEPAARNLISGNLFRGLQIFGNGGNTIQGNLIGTKANGTDPLGNNREGVQIISPNNTVGGIDSNPTDTNSPANLIAFNGVDGVKVDGGLNNAFAVGNRILSNSIFSNGDLGIDLDGSISPAADGDGVTANDSGDGDAGPNNLQNFPVLTSAALNADGSTTIEGTLNSTPSQTFTVQFFLADVDPSNFGEGKTYLGQKTDVATDASGNASFSFTTQENVSVGRFVTATATRLDTSTNPATPKDTSEFSEVEQVSEGNDPPVNSVPGAQSTNEDNALIFSQANNNRVSVSDPDAGTSSVQVRLQVNHGTMTVDGTSGLSFSPGDSGANDADMTFTGSLADVNAALDGMRFDPDADYNGSATLTITTDDQGNTGAGGAKTDTDTVNITVNVVNDAPSFTKGPNQSVQDKVGAQSVPNWATNISVGPPNEGAQSLQFILTSDNNALFTSTGRPAVSSNGTLSYTPRVNASGTANVQVVARDSGGTANGGNNTSDAQSFQITVNDATAPKVRNTMPTNRLTGVSPTANVTATFSEAMNANTLTNPTRLRSTTFTLVRKNADGTTTRVAAIVTYDATTKKATLNPDTNLRLGATYIATVKTGAKDVAGNALDQNPNTAGNQPKTWRFTVRT